MSNEQIIRECIKELATRKLARTPANVATLITQKNLPFLGSYDDLTALFWKILNDPGLESAYKRIIADDEQQGGTS
jgi:hypothetical protein